MVSPELRPLLALLRTRLHLVEKRTSAKNSVQRLLEQYNVPDSLRLPAEATLQALPYAEQIELLSDQSIWDGPEPTPSEETARNGV